jgi:hypothetical protein
MRMGDGWNLLRILSNGSVETSAEKVSYVVTLLKKTQCIVSV